MENNTDSYDLSGTTQNWKLDSNDFLRDFFHSSEAKQLYSNIRREFPDARPIKSDLTQDGTPDDPKTQAKQAEWWKKAFKEAAEAAGDEFAGKGAAIPKDLLCFLQLNARADQLSGAERNEMNTCLKTIVGRLMDMKDHPDLIAALKSEKKSTRKAAWRFMDASYTLLRTLVGVIENQQRKKSGLKETFLETYIRMDAAEVAGEAFERWGDRPRKLMLHKDDLLSEYASRSVAYQARSRILRSDGKTDYGKAFVEAVNDYEQANHALVNGAGEDDKPLKDKERQKLEKKRAEAIATMADLIQGLSARSRNMVEYDIANGARYRNHDAINAIEMGAAMVETMRGVLGMERRGGKETIDSSSIVNFNSDSLQMAKEAFERMSRQIIQERKEREKRRKAREEEGEEKEII